MPTVQVQLFAQLREHAGQPAVALSLAEGSTAQDAFRQLFGDTPLADLPVAYAVNAAYTTPAHVLRDGDELVFIPPIGGG